MTLREVYERLQAIRKECPLATECPETGAPLRLESDDFEERIDTLMSDLEHALREPPERD